MFFFFYLCNFVFVILFCPPCTSSIIYLENSPYRIKIMLHIYGYINIYNSFEVHKFLSLVCLVNVTGNDTSYAVLNINLELYFNDTDQVTSLIAKSM